MTRTSKLLLFGGTVIAAVFWLAVVFVLVWARGHSYMLKDARYAEASQAAVVKLFIPPEAWDINAWVEPYRMNVVASFRIREEDFVAWAKAEEWDLEEVEGTSVHNISRIGAPNDTVEISNGLLYRWIYDDEDPGSTFRVYAYDRADGTGYLTQLGD